MVTIEIVSERRIKDDSMNMDALEVNLLVDGEEKKEFFDGYNYWKTEIDNKARYLTRIEENYGGIITWNLKLRK